jgi:2-dehydro-3-deoxygluconokinase
VTRGAVVTIGESMALLTVPAGRQLRGGASAPVGFGGAESNVAIGLARLDVPVSWVSRVGDDAFGSLITRELRGEGVQVLSAVDGQAPTGLMVKEHRYGTPWRVRYYRAGSAASRLDPADLDTGAVTDAITAARVLHLTGITAAISPSALATVRRAIDIARAAGTVVSFDVNHRSALWSDAQAAPVLAQLCGSADLVFAGEAEAALVLGRPDSGAEGLARGLAGLGASTVVLKLGARGALALTGDRIVSADPEPITVADPVGAGDAFVAGYLSALVDGCSTIDCLRRGNRLGGAVCQVPGDWEGLPTREELESLTAVQEDVVR